MQCDYRIIYGQKPYWAGWYWSISNLFHYFDNQLEPFSLERVPFTILANYLDKFPPVSLASTLHLVTNCQVVIFLLRKLELECY